MIRTVKDLSIWDDMKNYGWNDQNNEGMNDLCTQDDQNNEDVKDLSVWIIGERVSKWRPET